MFLASVCVFVTTYNLILPAISVDKNNVGNVSGLYLDDADSTNDDQDTPDEPVSDGITIQEPKIHMQKTPNSDSEHSVNVYELSAVGDTYETVVTFDDKAGIPDGASLEVQEITHNQEASDSDGGTKYDEYIDSTSDTLGLNAGLISYARVFDISIVKDGEKVEPQGTTVDVRLALSDAEEDSEFNVVNFADGADEGCVVENTVDGQTIEFASDGSSVYVIVGTVIEKNVLTTDGKNYHITVTCEADSEIPANADLAVEEILPGENGDANTSFVYGKTYEEYVSKTENALGMDEGSTGYIRLFDIKIVDQDDPEVKYQPADGSKVDVKIELADAESGSLSVVHFPDGEETPDVIDNAEVTDAEYNGRVVKFQTDGFSVYAIVDGDDSTPETNSIKYVFHYSDKSSYTFININGDMTDTQYVKDGETVFYIGTPIDDPNHEGKEFWGWYAGTLNGDAIEWGDEIVFDTPISVSETTTVDVYARYEQTYYVTYYDENGNVYSVVKHANGDTIRLDITGTETLYTASNAQKAFLGWSTTAGTTEEIPEGTTLTVTGNVSLYPAINDVKWINFNAGETGNGASYTPPVYVLGSAVTADKKPDDPTRRGYAFRGWYKDEACTQEFKWDGTETLTDDITLYAKWTEADTIYTVVIWKQNLDGTGYDYVESRTVDALTGSTATTSTSDRNKNYKGFTYNTLSSDSSAIVLANGTTTLDVYYDRNEYTLTFQVQGAYVETTSTNGTQYGLVNGQYIQLTRNGNSWTYPTGDYDYTPTTSNSGTQYGLVNGEYVQLTRHGRNNNYYWTYNDGWFSEGPRYTGTRYIQTERTNIYDGIRYIYSSDWTTIKTITALYQQDISSDFPIVGTNGVTYNNGERWDPQSSTPYNEVLVFIDIMPAANVTFRLDTATRPLKTMNYYVEALPDSTGTFTAPGTLYEISNNGRTSANGLDFILYNSISARYNGVTPDEDFIDLVGFTRIGADSAWTTRSGTKFYIYDTSRDGTVNFYYSRNSYNLEFRNSDNTSVLYDTKSVKYQAPVAGEII